MYYDAHAHLQLGNNSKKKIENFQSMVAKYSMAAVVCNSTCEDDFEDVGLLQAQFKEHVIPCYGVHPWYIDRCKTGWLARLKVRLEKDERAFIGEIGLDKKRNFGAKQKEIFENQLKLVFNLCRPASVHCVKCHGTMFDILKKYMPRPEKKGIAKRPSLLFHDWSGSPEMTRMFVKNFPNIYFSFSTPVSGKKLGGVPINRVLAETDDKDPTSILKTYEELSLHFKKSKSEMICILQQNFVHCFDLPIISSADNPVDVHEKVDKTQCISARIFFLATLACLSLSSLPSIIYS